ARRRHRAPPSRDGANSPLAALVVTQVCQAGASRILHVTPYFPAQATHDDRRRVHEAIVRKFHIRRAISSAARIASIPKSISARVIESGGASLTTVSALSVQLITTPRSIAAATKRCAKPVDRKSIPTINPNPRIAAISGASSVS